MSTANGKYNGSFITPELFNEEIKKRELYGPNGWLLFVACNRGIDLAEQVKTEYEALLSERQTDLKEIPLLNDKSKNYPLDKKIVTEFDDTETNPRLPDHVAGSNAFVFQSVHELVDKRTANENYMQLLQLIRTLKVHGAKHITAVTPYLAGSRQEKPTNFKRESTLAKLNADLIITSGVDSILTYHLHSECIRGFYEPQVRFTALNGLDLFIEQMAPRFTNREDVICVSVDAGAAKFTIAYAEALNIDYAIANKFRPKQEKADLLGIIGDFKNKKVAIIGDDESVTVTSLNNVVKELYKKYDIEESFVLISHNKIRPQHVHKLIEAHEKYGLKEIHVTDTVPQSKGILELPFVHLHPIAERLAITINRLHYNQSVSQIFYRPKEKV